MICRAKPILPFLPYISFIGLSEKKLTVQTIFITYFLDRKIAVDCAGRIFNKLFQKRSVYSMFLILILPLPVMLLGEGLGVLGLGFCFLRL